MVLNIFFGYVLTSYAKIKLSLKNDKLNFN